ncbi:RloB family protein [Cryptosporangium sp. NPDC051539]|uniref:RloB family protein n=1 Tax=Cryptosporangium sp. NPDC051539 TaxID=3363962 RepID=UPI0037A41DCA
MNRRMRNLPQSLKRRSGFRKPRKTFVIFCEGKRTEPEYLEDLKRDPEVQKAAAVDLRIQSSNRSTPLALVDLAIDAQIKNAKEEGEVDEFWCVFDVEWPIHHPNLREAVQAARRAGVRLAISNPCFELWLILHFRDHSSFLDTDSARRLRRTCDGQPDKGVGSKAYMPNKHVAGQRAKALEQRHAENGRTLPDDNPSSGMHQLIDAVTANTV